MSSYERNNAINIKYENELNKLKKTAINHKFKQDQVPTPEPRSRLNQTTLTSISSSGAKDRQLRDELAMDNTQGPKLVRVKYHQIHLEDDVTVNIPVNQRTLTEPSRLEVDDSMPIQKRTSFTNALTIDEGVSSPTTYADYEDGDEVDDDCYEMDDEIDEDEGDAYGGGPRATGELVHLSKQSMVPLDELIAYYQYIQQGDNRQNKRSVSRQSSGSSQKTFRTNYSQQTAAEKTSTESAKPIAATLQQENDLDSANYSVEGPVSRVHLVEVESEKSNKKNDGTVEGEQEQQQHLAGAGDDANNLNQPHFSQNKALISAPKVDKQRIRANVVLELINSERDFVKHLRDVVEGYLWPARRHPEIFTGERINTIFANIEQLYDFQRKFLDCLESCINWNDLASSQVGHCFLEHEKGFSVYHHYCNNHPNATSELQDLYTKPRFVKFFEACRLLQNMIDISLDGFLLTPIQKICKYPLQLNELLKNTDLDHPDYVHVADALESMRNCANLANERKRRIEALADIMSFQEKVDSWFGPKLSETSSILIHSGEMAKMTRDNLPTWSHNVQLFLFDHLLIYSKRDLLKRNSLILKGRINMDCVTEISDADEYKPKRSFKIYVNYDNGPSNGLSLDNQGRECFVFVARSEKEKSDWIQAFERERNLIESDENEGFQITEREIGVARRALQNRKHSRSARYRHKRVDTAIVDQIDLDDANMIMNRTLSLPSCIRPDHVMNFVEDSRVVSTGKKSSVSPSSSSRSPMSSGSRHLSAIPMGGAGAHLGNPQEHDQPTSGSATGNWFKKMGSRKLSKGQVYTINGAQSLAAGGQQHHFQLSHSPTSSVIATAASTVTEDSAALKYDQLEKRHRDHMVSDEQARLMRLNNDLVPPASTLSSFGRSSSAGHKQQHQLGVQMNPNPQRSSLSCISRQPQEEPRRLSSSSATRDQMTPGQLDFQSLSLNRSNKMGASTTTTATSTLDHGELAADQPATFEATVLLSSGRVVRVREDAV